MRAASGNLCASQWLRPSMVWTCRRDELRSRSQPRERLCASAAPASAWSSRTCGVRQLRGARLRVTTRARSVAHLGRRLARERDRDDLLRAGHRCQQTQVAQRQEARLARARRRLDDERAAGFDRLAPALSSRMASVPMARFLLAVLARPGRLDTAQRPEMAKSAGLAGQLRIDLCGPAAWFFASDSSHAHQCSKIASQPNPFSRSSVNGYFPAGTTPSIPRPSSPTPTKRAPARPASASAMPAGRLGCSTA